MPDDTKRPMVIEVFQDVIGAVYGLIADPSQISKGVTTTLDATQEEKLSNPLSYLWNKSSVDDISLTLVFVVGITPGINTPDDIQRNSEKIIRMALPPTITKMGDSGLGVRVSKVSVFHDGNAPFFSQRGIITSAKYTVGSSFDISGKPLDAKVDITLKPHYVTVFSGTKENRVSNINSATANLNELPSNTNFKLSS